jgi:chemotaxis protein methyltransferase WspC
LRFEVANLLDEPDPALHGRFDAVFCRHLLIYLDAAARQRLARWLRLLAVPRDGLIFVGPAEAAAAFGGALQPLDWPCAFGFHNRERGRGGVSGSVSGRHTAERGAAAAPPQLPSATAAPAAALTQAAPAAAPTQAAVEALADRGDLAAAWTAAQALVAARALDPDVHALLGLLAESRGDAAQARRSYLSALYLAPQHRASLHHLLLMAQTAGDQAEAGRLRLRLARAVAAAAAE